MTKEVILKFDFKLISKDNEKIRNRSGRYYLSKKYKNFEKLIKDCTAIQLREKYNSIYFEKDVQIQMNLFAYFKSKVHADMWNLPKSLADALQGIVYENDRQIKQGEIKVLENCERDAFTVYINQL